MLHFWLLIRNMWTVGFALSNQRGHVGLQFGEAMCFRDETADVVADALGILAKYAQS
jgi:hypothetical protein